MGDCVKFLGVHVHANPLKTVGATFDKLNKSARKMLLSFKLDDSGLR